MIKKISEKLQLKVLGMRLLFEALSYLRSVLMIPMVILYAIPILIVLITLLEFFSPVSSFGMLPQFLSKFLVIHSSIAVYIVAILSFILHIIRKLIQSIIYKIFPITSLQKIILQLKILTLMYVFIISMAYMRIGWFADTKSGGSTSLIVFIVFYIVTVFVTVLSRLVLALFDILPLANNIKQRVYVVHGWDGHPEDNWFPWLKKEFEAKGFEVFVPQLPETENPRISDWVPKLAETVGVVDENTYFVGHSMGCQAIVRYLESLPDGVKVGGAVFVAGFFKRVTVIGDDQNIQEMFHHWLSAPINFERAKSHLSKSIAIFSDNDPYVPLDNQDDFRNKLDSDIIIKHQKGHFCTRDGAIKLPIVFKSVLDIYTYTFTLKHVGVSTWRHNIVFASDNSKVIKNT